jgi:hypothetical protein
MAETILPHIDGFAIDDPYFSEDMLIDNLALPPNEVIQAEIWVFEFACLVFGILRV